jgi:mono/diheme cytochrome c family protein
MTIRKITVLGICAILIGSALSPSFAKKKKVDKKISGASIYQSHCASCHGTGGNLVSDKHPIAGSSHLGTLAQFKQYLESPPGHMPRYDELMNDKESLQALYEYCKTLKKPKTAFIPSN